MHRRDFVKTVAAGVSAGAGAAAALAARPIPQPPAAPAAGGPDLFEAPTLAAKPLEGPVKVGLIGCGGRGTGAAAQALRADAGVELVAVGDVFESAIDACLRNLRAELEHDGPETLSRIKVDPDRRFVGFDAYRRVIDSGVDVVLLTAYPHFRPEHLAAAIAAGKHTFAEKPLAIDGPGIRSVLASADESAKRNLACLVGFCWRYNDGMRGTFGAINGGAIGDVVSVHTTYHTETLSKRPRQPGWSDMEFQLRNWWHFAWLSGDHIVEQAVHSIDRLAWAMNDRLPLRATCLGGRAARSGPESGDVFDHFAAIYEYQGGRRCFHTCRQIDRCPNDNTDYVYGTQGQAVINGWAPTYSLRDPVGKEIWSFAGRTDRDMYQNEHNALFASLRAGTPINDLRRGVNATIMAVMARMAAYTGQTVTWEQAIQSFHRLGPPGPSDEYEFGPLPEPEVPIPGRTRLV